MEEDQTVFAVVFSGSYPPPSQLSKHLPYLSLSLSWLCVAAIYIKYGDSKKSVFASPL